MRKFSVPDMSCGHCKAAVEKAVAGVDDKARVVVDLENRTVETDASVDDAVLIAALKAEGYDAHPA